MDRSEEMQEKFGNAETESYVRSVKALRSLVIAQGVFMESPAGSVEEEGSRMVLESMLGALKERPTHAINLLDLALSALVVLIEEDPSTWEKWLATVGLGVNSAADVPEAMREAVVTMYQLADGIDEVLRKEAARHE